LIEKTAELGLPYVYLGYYIAACQKMSYKADYCPLERFQSGEWIRFDT
jgi:leucyl-tRNA---protein transferase